MATGRAARERLERARAVSALIGADASAHAAFDEAYTGRGAALGALEALLHGDAADPDRTARLDRHRRSAFARPDGPADHAAAADALVALRREEERSDADAAALDRAIDVVLELQAEQEESLRAAAELATALAASHAAAGTSASDPDAPPTRRGLRPLLAAAVVVAAIGLGAGGESLVSGALAGPDAVESPPSPITYFRDPAVRDADAEVELEVGAIGDPAAADRWLGGEQTPQDIYPVAFDDIAPDSTRLVYTATNGWRVWVGRGTDTDYCLLAYSDAEGTGASSCIDAEGFAQGGAALATGYNSITWTGAELTVTLSRR